MSVNIYEWYLGEYMCIECGRVIGEYNADYAIRILER